MSPLLALLLGIVQGLTEFLPISSSGHLKLFEYLFGLRDLDAYLPFDLVCHLGTLTALLIIFGPDVRSLFSRRRFTLLLLVIGTLPLVPLALIKGPLSSLYASPKLLGPFFILTALLLFLGERARTLAESKPAGKLCRDALVIGAFQALALIPGVSRSGSTITGARLMGWDRYDAVRFSFLLSLPAVLGACLLTGLELARGDIPLAPMGGIDYAIGYGASLITGYGALKLLLRWVEEKGLKAFAWYCFGLGLFATLIFNIG
ncbi:MAG: undecaprenyl-diphosphate phosphatase [Parachlamydiales bacterium]